MIKAYHQVGSDEWSSEERAQAIREIRQVGMIHPASSRMDRHEMEIECFTGKNRGSTLIQRFPKATPKGRAALKELAQEKIDRLPESGFTQGLFNCLDLLSGDFELIFLRPGGWYSVDNGFVFDAEQLLKKGARFRRTDLLGGYHAAVEGALSEKYDSIEAAKEVILLEIGAIQDHFQSTGRQAIKAMKDNLTPTSEIVWRGSLPIDLALEIWSEGRLVWSR